MFTNAPILERLFIYPHPYYSIHLKIIFFHVQGFFSLNSSKFLRFIIFICLFNNLFILWFLKINLLSIKISLTKLLTYSCNLEQTLET